MKEKVVKFIKNCFWLSSEDGKNQKEIYAFNAMRFIAFLFIFFSHSKAYFKDPGLHQAALGVAFFFIISGFLNGYLRKGVEKINIKSIYNYTKKKFSKIYPLLLFVILIMLPRVGLFNIKDWKGFFTFLGKLIPGVTMTSSWINDEGHYFAFFAGIWYISTFFFLVLLTPILLKVVEKIRQSKHGAVKLLLLAGVLYGLSMVYVVAVNKQYYFCKIFPPARLFEYTIGIIFGYLMATGEPLIKLKKNLNKTSSKKLFYSCLEILSILAVVVVAVAVQSSGNIPNFLSKNMNIFTIPLVLMLCVFSRQSGVVSLLLSNKPIVILGRASMYLYLIHMPIRYWLGIKVKHELLYGLFLLTVTIVISLYLYNRSKKNENHSTRI